MQGRYISTVGMSADAACAVGCGIRRPFLSGVFLLFRIIPNSFLPEEDQGYFITIVQLPDGASKQRTDTVLSKIEITFLGQSGDSFNGPMRFRAKFRVQYTRPQCGDHVCSAQALG